MKSKVDSIMRDMDRPMKAVVFDKNRQLDALVYRDVEMPVPKDGEVLVRIYAVSVNAADSRSMKMGIVPKRKIFGADIAGRIEAVGKDTNIFDAGDEVFGDIASFGFGGFAEYAAVPEKALALKPAGISFETAAAVPMAAVTALQALRDKGAVGPGKKVLIYGAGGGVGTFAVQLAKYFDAEVTAVCSSNNAEQITLLGAGRVIKYDEQDFTDTDIRFDIILAVNGNNPLPAYKRMLAPNGICVMVGGAMPQIVKAILFGAVNSTGGKKIRILAAKPNTKDLEYLIRLVEEGSIKPVIDRRYPLSMTAEAMRYMGEGHARGKVVINVID
jgi:NADPH:quinone reductase-like Zn-dependent oxidoreductase